MVKITVGADCGNAPKKALLRDFNIAVAKGDLSLVELYITKDLVWNLYEPAGQKVIHGRDEVIKEYRENLVIKPEEFIFESIITHGDEGAVSGTIKTKHKRFVFGDFYKFGSHAKGAKIKQMTSYVIEKTIEPEK